MAVVDIMANMGEDALSNHFQVVIPAINQLGVSVANLNMRVLTIGIPDRVINTYDITKRGRTFARPNGKIEQEKTVTLSFRHDKYFQCYKSLINWMNFIQDNQTGAMASDSGPAGIGGASEFRHNIEVWAINGLDNAVPNTIWTLEGAYPTSVQGIDFDENGGDDAMTCDVTLTCMNIIYPEL